MSIINETLNILDKTAYALNEAAFGDIRNIFNSNWHNFRNRPIGLLGKSYDFMLDHLYRNIGNSEYVYDGYSTPIGEVANPFYNTIVRVPWFYNDYYKNSTANYLDYMRYVYGASLSVENINEIDTFHLSDDASAVGYVDGRYAIDALQMGVRLLPNVNETGTDTRLGIDSGYYNTETLKNAVVLNDERKSFNNGISSTLTDYLGLTTSNIVDNRTYTKVISPLTGRFADGVFNPLHYVNSPVEVSNYGHIGDIGSYIGYYNSLGEKSKKYFEDNVYAEGKKYYPLIMDNGNINHKGKTYLGSIGVSVGHDKLSKDESNGLEAVAIDELQIRYIFSTLEEHSNIVNYKDAVYVYAEDEYGSSPDITYLPSNTGMRFGHYSSYGNGLTANDLLKKTNTAFKDGRYKTIISRFHTNPTDAEETDTTQTAISKKYGLSHGRNLLKLVPDESQGYENPYCRVWTFHHQYHRIADAIRPFDENADELYNKYNFKEFTADNSGYGFENGRLRLEKHGTLNKNNGLVNITPIDTGDKKVDIKNCMFSIENLAWKDAFSTDAESRKSFQVGGLSAEQKGPFGGRIMWFPPYDLKFNEDISVNWNETNFIGRGEGIYTYTNTTRTGNLSFKILVDHPSIIDYWENKGKSVSNSVDDIDDPEQELLRFFAGCDMLTGKTSQEPEKNDAIVNEPIPTSDSIALTFFVFYPNNYSGVNDDPEDALKYLTNGLGAGKTKNANGVTVDYSIPYEKASNGYGGYEMISQRPISIVSKQPDDKNPHIANVRVGENVDVELFVQEGDSTDEWYRRKWYYRVDNIYKNQDLLKKNYIDKASFCLNSFLGQANVADFFGIKDTSNLYSLADVYVALQGGNTSEVLSGLYDKDKSYDFLNKIKQFGVKEVVCEGFASVQGYSSLNETLQLNRATTIRNWLRKKSEFKDLSISNMVAAASGTGGRGPGVNNGDESDIANKLWRCSKVSIYLKSSVSETVQNRETEGYKQVMQEGGQVERRGYINTTEKTPEILDRTGAEYSSYFGDMSENINVANEYYKDRVKSIKLKHLSDNLNNLSFNLRNSVRNGNVNLNSAFGAVAEFSEHSKHFNYDNLGFISEAFGGKNDVKYNQYMMHDNAELDRYTGENDSLEDKVEATERQQDNNNKVVRYDNEARFFQLLEKEEPFLHHKISDKIKYFDPAFHSISPEGFNARLTFLQQCTRQGPTIGNSDNGTETTANNLSFGRPPVCILRIGDFYYTKIIIDSISISFDPLVWDLNTEGIGVMPMIADINMRFKFIGGSSLAGHITRLQNALSFNYYANTEVYDNRSELADYDDSGNITKFKPNPINK